MPTTAADVQARLGYFFVHQRKGADQRVDALTLGELTDEGDAQLGLRRIETFAALVLVLRIELRVVDAKGHHANVRRIDAELVDEKILGARKRHNDSVALGRGE